MNTNTNTDWEALYVRGAFIPGLDCLPWDIGEPQPAIALLEHLGLIDDPVLDAGCGKGDTAIDFAQLGHDVSAFDISPTAIAHAEQAARRVGARVNFFTADALTFDGFDDGFATIIDSTLYHSIPIAGQEAYLERAHRATRPGGRLHVLAFSDAAPFPSDTPNRPNCSTRDELVERVARRWSVEEVRPSYVAAWMPGDALESDLEVDESGRVRIPAWLVTARKNGGSVST